VLTLLGRKFSFNTKPIDGRSAGKKQAPQACAVWRSPPPPSFNIEQEIHEDTFWLDVNVPSHLPPLRFCLLKASTLIFGGGSGVATSFDLIVPRLYPRPGVFSFAYRLMPSVSCDLGGYLGEPYHATRACMSTGLPQGARRRMDGLSPATG